MRKSTIPHNPESIQRQMETVRCEMIQDVREIKGDVRSYFDWRAYVKKSPWICLTAAFAAGYLLVPKSKFGKPTISVGSSSTAEIPGPPPKNKRIISGLLTFANNLALRGISAYVENQAVKLTTACASKPRWGHAEEDLHFKPREATESTEAPHNIMLGTNPDGSENQPR
jgi:hypothetical protein